LDLFHRYTHSAGKDNIYNARIALSLATCFARDSPLKRGPIFMHGREGDIREPIPSGFADY
jgi:hypothetical protein